MSSHRLIPSRFYILFITIRTLYEWKFLDV